MNKYSYNYTFELYDYNYYIAIPYFLTQKK